MTDFILPDIGEGIVECELLKWLVAEGDTIKEDQAVAEVMTDKATVEIPAMYDGVVQKLYYKEGDIAKVHAPLFAMIRSDESNEAGEHAGDSFNKEENTTASKSAQIDTQVESFVLPDIGEGIVECEIVKWSVAQGDTVEEDQVVVEVMTDKAVVEIPAKHPGQILKLHYQEGEIAKVHSPLFDQAIAVGEGGAVQEVHSSAQEQGSVTRDTVSKEATGSSVQSAGINANVGSVHVDNVHAENKQGENFEAPVQSSRALASPAVRRLARELGLNLAQVKASGKKGRVLKADVLAASNNVSLTQQVPTEQLPTEQASSAAKSHSEQERNSQSQVKTSDRVEPIKGIRAAMAKQMLASVSTIPHFTVSDELVMDNLIALRKTLKPDFEAQGIKLSFMPFFIKALSLAMLEFPIINSRLNDQGTELTYLSSHNIGMAVDSKIGLLVPNIKNVQSLSLKELAVEVNRLVDSAREGKLSNSDLSGGTMSISNIGAIGGITATPVINKPDVAIVALGKTQKLPRFDEQGNVCAQSIMMVNWSGDHRVIDGATMVKFNNLWMDYLMHPQKMLVNLR